MKHALYYHGIWLCRGSEAHRLHSEGDWQKLAKHMKQLEANEKVLTGSAVAVKMPTT